MADGDGDNAGLERQLHELKRRVSELEVRISNMEARPAPNARPEPAQPAQPHVPLAPWEAGWFQQDQQQRQAQQQLQAQQQWQVQQQWLAEQQARRQAQQQQAQQQWAKPVQQQPSQPRPVYAGEAQGVRKDATQPILRTATAPQRPPVKNPSLSEEFGNTLASLRDLESRMTGRLLAWAGAAAVVLGTVFFLSLAFSRGWIGPEGRVALGLIGGAACAGAGAWMFGRKEESLGHVLVASGLGIISLSLFAGTRYYDLYAPEWALAGSFLAAVAVAAIAVRVNSEAVAIYGLLAIAAAPPVMGAGANTVTIAFLAVTVLGATLIALVKSWRWLPPTIFLLTMPQLVFWLIGRPDAATAVAAIAAYWLLHALAASADELRPTKDAVEGRPDSLFLANSIVAIGGGLYVLSGGHAEWQGAFMVGAAVAHLAFGAYFVLRRGELDSFGVFINAIAAACVAIAIERQFSGAAVVIGWSIEGVVFAAIFGRRRNIYAGSAAAILCGLSLVHFCVYEYAFLDWSLKGRAGAGQIPFDNPAGLALAGLLITGFLAGWMSKRSDVRLVLLMVGSVLSAYSLPFELSGPALITAWAILGAALVGVWRSRPVDYVGWTAVAMGSLAVAHLGLYEYPVDRWFLGGATGPGVLPFADSAGLALGCLLAAGALAAWLSRNRDVRFGLLIAGSLVLGYTLPFELSGPSLVAGWVAEAVALTAVWGFRRHPGVAVAAATMGAFALAQFAGYEYVWSGWTTAGSVSHASIAFVDSAGVALGCLLVGLALAATVSQNHDVRCGLTTAGLFLVAYSLPFELSGIALVAGWAALLPVAIAAERLLDLLPGVPESRAELRRVPMLDMNEAHWPDSPLLAAWAGAVLAIMHLLAYDLPLSSAASIVVPATPFVDLATASAAVAAVAFLAAAALTARPDIRAGAIITAAAIAAYAATFELALPYAVVVWCGLAIALGGWAIWMRYARWAYVSAAAALVAAAAIAVLAQIDPVWRLGVQGSVPLTGLWFDVNATVAIGAGTVAVTAGARFLPLDKHVRSALTLAVGIALVYLASTLVVGFFQGQVGGRTALEELQKQAQVSVSILWGLIGMAVFLAGLVGWRQGIREAGLGLLILATAKVFLFDLSYLDVAYRVLSLVGLGILLLLGAYAYQTLRPRRPAAEDAPDEAAAE